jgi:hypothetical protein
MCLHGDCRKYCVECRLEQFYVASKFVPSNWIVSASCYQVLKLAFRLSKMLWDAAIIGRRIDAHYAATAALAGLRGQFAAVTRPA